MTAAHVRRITTEVFLAPNGRRYLTKRAAYRKAAYAAVLAKYECDCSGGDYGEPPYTCIGHDGSKEKLIRRVARLMQRHDEANS